MPENLFAVPADVTFEQAIALTQSLMVAMEQGLADAELEQAVAALVQSENGARGFFVTYLTDPRPIADHATPLLLEALRSSPDIVAELLVKNLAMSAAMAVQHRRNQDEEMAQGSDRVRSRTAELIQALQLPATTQRVQQMAESAATGQGEYASFLSRWNYDAEQRSVIQEAAAAVFWG